MRWAFGISNYKLLTFINFIKASETFVLNLERFYETKEYISFIMNNYVSKWKKTDRAFNDYSNIFQPENFKNQSIFILKINIAGLIVHLLCYNVLQP